MRLRSGYLTSKVTLQQPTIKQDELGQPRTEWADVVTVWANLADFSGREYVASSSVQNTAQTKIIIRYREGVTPSMRIVHKKDIYHIEAVLGQDKLSLLLMCSKQW